MKNIKLLILAAGLVTGFVLLFFYRPGLSDNHGRIKTELYLGKGNNQSLVVTFGGGEGGNAWASERWKSTREMFNNEGYALLAIGYFGAEGLPQMLDRISLDAIHDSIMNIAQHPLINAEKIALMGASKGGELVLNLASLYPEYSAVVAIVPPHTNFPALTPWMNTSSWTHNSSELSYVEAPINILIPAIQGDLFGAFSLMLADSLGAQAASIPVENVNGPMLLISAKNDEQWPSTHMCHQIKKRLRQSEFKFHVKHIELPGDHSSPLAHFDTVANFLNSHLKTPTRISESLPD